MPAFQTNAFQGFLTVTGTLDATEGQDVAAFAASAFNAVALAGVEASDTAAVAASVYVKPFSASLALQGAIVTRLKDAAAGLIGTRVYDRIPADAAFPFVEVAGGQELALDAECIFGLQVMLDIHVWSRAVGAVECRQIAGLVRTALHDASLTITGWKLVDLKHRDTRFLSDPDGITTHAVVTVRALVDPE